MPNFAQSDYLRARQKQSRSITKGVETGERARIWAACTSDDRKFLTELNEKFNTKLIEGEVWKQ